MATYVPGVSEKFNIRPYMSDDEIEDVAIMDYDLFYVYLADCMVNVPVIVEFINEKYEENKYSYYEKAKNNPQYNATIMTDGSLEREVLCKKAFALLLAAQESIELQNSICNLFILYYPPFKLYKKPYDRYEDAQLESRFHEFVKPRKGEDPRAANLMSAYIVDRYHGLDNQKVEGVSFTKLYAISSILSSEKGSQETYINRIKDTDIHECIRTPKPLREFRKLIQNTDDIISIINYIKGWYVQEKHEDRCHSDPHYAAIFDFLESSEYADILNELNTTSLIIGEISALTGKNICQRISKEKITSEEMELIYKSSAICLKTKTEGSRLAELRPSDYFIALVVFLLFKSFKSDRDFHFRNNAETLFTCISQAKSQIKQLQDQIGEKNALIQDTEDYVAYLKTQNDDLKEAIFKREKDVTKPLVNEITELNRQLEYNQEKILSFNEIKLELNRLREFAFAVQSNSDIEPTEFDIKSLIENKTVYVFGGHINWRNKLQRKYPSIKIMDGHNTSFDEHQLLTADLVLFNVSNMSHALYYKVIPLIRHEKVAFDYIGKYSNTDLLEQEIAEAIQKHF